LARLVMLVGPRISSKRRSAVDTAPVRCVGCGKPITALDYGMGPGGTYHHKCRPAADGVAAQVKRIRRLSRGL
jgi:hypothetical protein